LNNKTKNALRFIPMVVIMVIIFAFSAMEGDDSSNTSGFFVTTLVKIVEEVSHKGLSVDAINNIHLVIRKMAHFTEYAALGVSIMFAIWHFWNNHKLPLLLPEVIAAVYASTDEFHQYYVPGRYGTWTDVLIDSAGALTGILIYYFIWKKVNRK